MTAPERVPALPDLLYQSESWIQDGQLVPLSSLTERHRSNLLLWLERRASSLHAAQEHQLLSLGSFIAGEFASEDLDRTLEQMAEEDPLEWLRETPLHREDWGGHLVGSGYEGDG